MREANGFVFASELKALWHVAGCTKSLDVSALFRYLGYLWSPGGATPINGGLSGGAGRGAASEGSARHPPLALGALGLDRAPPELGRAEAIRRVREACARRSTAKWLPMCLWEPFFQGELIPAPWWRWRGRCRRRSSASPSTRARYAIAGVTDDLPYARRVAKHLGVRLHEIQVDSSSYGVRTSSAWCYSWTNRWPTPHL